MNHHTMPRAVCVMAAVLLLAALATAQSTRTYTYNNVGNRTNATNQVRFTSAAGFSIDPLDALVGQRVNLYGRNFPTGREADVTVTVGGANATIVSAAARVITFTMPPGAQTGDVVLSIVGGPQNQIVGRISLRGVSVAPSVIELGYGENTTFTAQAIGATNTAVTWRVNNIAGGNGSVGTITSGGLYTAPNLGTGVDYPYVVSAFNAELNMTGYALVKPRCNSRTTIPNRAIVNGTFATSSIRHCYEFTGVAGEFAFVALRSTVNVQSVTLRDADGVALAAIGAGTDLRLPDVLLPTAGTYQIEVLGNASTFGPYEIYVDRHPALPRGVWLSPFSGTWQTPGNWSRGELPQATDQVTIGNFTPDLTVTMSSGSQACATLTSAERLEITGGNLTVAGPVQVNNAVLRLTGGRLRSAIVVPGTGNPEILLDGGITLEGVVFAANTVLRHTGTTWIERGVTCDGTWNVDSGTILFQDSSSFLGTGNVYLGSTQQGFLYAAQGVSMTLGSSLSIRVNTGTVGADNSSFIALGLIHAVQPGGTLNLRGDGWENRGVIDAVSGTTVNTFGTWDNNGLLRTTNATLNLGGTFRFGDIGNCQHVGGTVNLTGTLDNTASTLVLTPSMLNWRLKGTIRGGEIETQAPAQLLIDGTCTLDGVRLKPGAVARNLAGHTINFRNGLTVDGTLYANSGSLLGGTNQTLGGSGTVEVGSGSTGYLYSQSGLTLTIAPTLTVKVGTGYVGYSGDHIRNQGTIRCDRQNGTLYLNGASWRNEGLVDGQNGCTVQMDTAASTNLGTMTQAYGTLNFRGTWTNSGTINAVVATVTLGGTFSLSTLGALNALASEVAIVGTLQNTPDLILSATTGSWYVRSSGTIQNCRITTLDATELVCDGTATFRDVTVQNGGMVRVVSATLNIRGNLTVNGSLFATSSSVYLQDNNAQVLGTGTVVLGPSTSYLYGPAGVSWTLGVGTTVRVIQGYVGYSTGTFTNRGTIRCDTAGGTAHVGATNWTNLGSLVASNGGDIRTVDAWTSSGSMTVGPASTLRLAGQFTNTGLGSYTNNGGQIWLEGTLTNGGILNLAGTWSMRNGTIVGGRLQTAAGAELLFDGAGTLDNVTVDPGARVRVTGGNQATLRNGLVVNGRIKLDWGYLRITTNNLILSGSGEIELATASTSQIYGNSAIAWAIETGLTVRCTGSGQFGNGNDTFVNRGLLSAEGPNRFMTLNADAWENRGKIHVLNNCTLRLDGTNWRNSTGTIVQTNGEVELRGTFGPTALGSFTPSGGEVHVVGTCEIAGGTLTLNPPTTGTWRMRNGTLRNGTLAGTELLFDGTGTLDGMTLAAGATARATGGNTIRVLNGLTNNGTIRLDYGYLQILTNNTTLAGTGTVEFANSTGSLSYIYGTTNVAFTIGTGQIVRALGNGLIGGGATNENVVNRGTLRAEGGTSRTLRLNGSPSFDNQGTIVCNTATATLRFEGTNWRNTTGTITHQNGTLQLDGTFPTTALGTFSSTGGEVHLTGTCDVGAATLTMNSATIGSWRLRNGTIRSTTQNGVLASAPGSELLVDGTGTLDGMRIAAGSLVRVTGGNTLNLRTGVNIDGRLLLDTGWAQFQTSGMTAGGTGQVEFGNSSTGTSYLYGPSWTIGAGLTVRAIGNGQIGWAGGESWVNLGTIRAETNGRTLTLANVTMNNRNRIEVVGGGRINATTFTQNDAAAVTSIANGCTLQATTVNIQQGRLEGAGTVQGNLTNAGTIRPGGAAAAGILTVTGTFSQTAAGRIEIELGGTTPGTGHDRLAVGGAATFGGALVASTLSGYVPPNPSQFDVLTYASRTGTLTFTPPGGVGMTPNYQATLLRLTVP